MQTFQKTPNHRDCDVHVSHTSSSKRSSFLIMLSFCEEEEKKIRKKGVGVRIGKGEEKRDKEARERRKPLMIE